MKCIIFFLFFNLFSFSQNVSAKKWHFPFGDKTEAESFANKDILTNSIFIYLRGGMAPVVYTTDNSFEKRYNITFNDEGCIGSEFSKYYNFIIFDYLKKSFGKIWIKEIRKDVLGLKEWEKQH